MKQLLAVLFAASLFGTSLPAGAAVADDGLVTQLATDHVEITAQFTGEHVMLFGAMSRPGDVIVKVVSPNEDVALSRKVETGPFWLNSGKLTVKGTPGLLYLLASRRIEDIAKDSERKRYGLDIEDALSSAQVPDDSQGMSDWREAFLRLKKNNEHYLRSDSAIKLVRNRLFLATVPLPAKLPLGTYQLDIYLVNNGTVISHQHQTLEVEQVRLEHWVSQMAHEHSWTFGIAFTVFAMGLGLGLGIALRRSSDA